ncbi:hypothetical protein NBRC116583_37860 [Arenicella sp. 4NH20-0111]
MRMKINAWDFSAVELERWAYDSNARFPDQDWELAVAISGNDDLVLKLSQDESCPNRDFMVSCLYMIVGDFLHSGSDFPNRESEIINLAKKANESKNSKVYEWSEKTIHILKNKNEFEYNDWCWV